MILQTYYIYKTGRGLVYLSVLPPKLTRNGYTVRYPNHTPECEKRSVPLGGCSLRPMNVWGGKRKIEVDHRYFKTLKVGECREVYLAVIEKGEDIDVPELNLIEKIILT